MTELERRHYFLTEDEFALCCTAAGIDRVCGFRRQRQEAPSPAEMIETVFSLSQRGLLRMDGRQFVLSRELSECFRLIRGSRGVLLASRGNGPCGLLYGNSERLVSLCPGKRLEDYVSLALYGRADLAAWLTDVSLLPADGVPEELVEAAGPWSLAEAEIPSLVDSLSGQTWPGSAQELAEPFPPGVAACIESRRTAGRQLLGRVFLVRQPLFDWVIAGSASGVTNQPLHPGALVKVVENLLREVGENK